MAIKRKYLFGSRAKGNFSDHSDSGLFMIVDGIQDNFSSIAVIAPGSKHVAGSKKIKKNKGQNVFCPLLLIVR